MNKKRISNKNSRWERRSVRIEKRSSFWRDFSFFIFRNCISYWR